MSTAVTEPAKPAAKQSFYSEEHSQRLNYIRVPDDAEVERAKNLVFRQHDADLLGQMIFGEAL